MSAEATNLTPVLLAFKDMRMSPRNFASVLTAIAVVLSACGKDDSVDPRAQQLADAVCPRAYECCSSAQLADNDQAASDVAGCRTLSARAWNDTLTTVKASERKGRSALDAAKLQGCVATIKTSTCELLNRTNHFSGVAGCDRFVTPKVAAGAACENDWECVGGECEKAEKAREGVCGLVALEGESCAAVDCARGLTCLGDNKTCFRPRAEGEACTQDVDCASQTCATGAERRCAPAVTAANQCFYASGCSYGDRRPLSWLGLLALVALVGAVRLRRRSSR